MGGFTVRITGLKELDDKLTALKATEAKKIIRKALRDAGKVVQAAVQERAPERPPLPSGTALPPGALALDIELGLGFDDDGIPAAIVGPGKYTEHAARWVEYGHRLVRGGYSKVLANGRRRGAGKEIGEVPAHPFIRPGFEASAGPATEVLIESVKSGIEKAMKA
jgi:HK97 gp10 family phage protein